MSAIVPRLLVGLAFVALAAALPSAAHAEDQGSPYRLKWHYDVPLLALGAAGTMAGFVGYPPPACHPQCVPPSGMLGIDDSVVGNYSRSSHSVANVLVLSMIGLPLVIDAIDSRFHGWFEDAAIMLETLALTQGVTQLTKSAVRRTAPFVYNPNAEREDLESSDATRSFISGHSSTAFSMAAAFSVTFWKRHPASPWRFVVLGVSEGVAITIAALKIKAGYHYPTDVTAGALVGSAMGVLVPMLHTEW